MNYPNPIQYLDFNNLSLGLQNLNINISQAVDFENSHIEMNSAGQLLLATNDRFAAIGNANSPNSITWTNNFMAINYAPNDQNETLTAAYSSFILPDQKDLDPNCQIGCYDLTCDPSNPDISFCELYSSLSPEVLGFPNDIVVSQSTTWQPGGTIDGQTIPSSGLIKVLGDIIVEPGVTLNLVNMEIEFSSESTVYVRRGATTSSNGAKLIVDNSTLTALNDCGECFMWPGIIAEGYINSSTFSNAQALVNLKNNAQIEYAQIGIRCGTGLKAGAKVYANNATFLNNRYDVYFDPFSNAYTNSYFSSCNFTTDDNLHPSVSYPVHVLMFNLRGITFGSCNFSNETPISESNLNRGTGIYAANSYFKVYKIQGQNSGIFNAQRFGIYTTHSNGTKNFDVYNTNFIDNFYGIYASSARRNIIKGNSFTVFNTDVFTNPFQETYGIQLRGCTDYDVSSNYFDISSPASKDKFVYGCIVDNSGPFANQILDNNFNELHTAGSTRRQNCTAPGLKPVGLRWLCNEFSNQVGNDLWIEPNATLHTTQGGLANGSAAGNIFNNNPELNIKHEGSQNPIRYMHQPTPTQTPQYIYGNVITLTTGTNVCPNSPGSPNPDPNTLISDFQSVRQALVDERDSVLATIDYGSTDSVVLEILDPYLSPLQKRELLTQENMTISDEVLIRYIHSDPIHADLFYVLTFNSPLSDAVLQEMMDVSTLPLGMQQQILLLAQGFTESDIKMSIIQDYTLKINAVERDYLSYVLADSTNLDPYGELILVYENEVEHNFDVLDNLFNLYVADGNVAKADSVNTLVKALADDNSYAFLNDLAVASMTTDMFTLLEDSTTVLTLEMIADQHDYRDGMRAQSILSGYLGYEFDAVFKGNKNMGVTRELTLPSSSNDVSLFPNPAEDYFFVVRNETGQIDASRKVNIYNLSGILVQSIDFAPNNLSLEISTKSWDHGFYLVEVIENGVSISTKRVLVR